MSGLKSMLCKTLVPTIDNYGLHIQPVPHEFRPGWNPWIRIIHTPWHMQSTKVRNHAKLRNHYCGPSFHFPPFCAYLMICDASYSGCSKHICPQLILSRYETVQTVPLTVIIVRLQLQARYEDTPSMHWNIAYLSLVWLVTASDQSHVTLSRGSYATLEFQVQSINSHLIDVSSSENYLAHCHVAEASVKQPVICTAFLFRFHVLIEITSVPWKCHLSYNGLRFCATSLFWRNNRHIKRFASVICAPYR